MHELAVTQGILSVALDAAREHHARYITAIDLVVGELSSIVDDSVQFYFDHLSQGTPAEHARLHFRRVPATLVCLDCAKRHGDIRPPVSLQTCPDCGSARLQISGGMEFYVESIEVDNENPGG
ncbi:MAG: hydrogenase maturation nickel metallochaperone HypA [Chloroflexi bacterium]|nr:hydrogenase maturation nickel metallochaperone HypA [Chloroflexota bacterium]